MPDWSSTQTPIEFLTLPYLYHLTDRTADVGESRFDALQVTETLRSSGVDLDVLFQVGWLNSKQINQAACDVQFL